jgi:hypothetical protein
MKAKYMSAVRSGEIPGCGLAHAGSFSVGRDFMRTI